MLDFCLNRGIFSFKSFCTWVHSKATTITTTINKQWYWVRLGIQKLKFQDVAKVLDNKTFQISWSFLMNWNWWPANLLTEINYDFILDTTRKNDKLNVIPTVKVFKRIHVFYAHVIVYFLHLEFWPYVSLLMLKKHSLYIHY